MSVTPRVSVVMPVYNRDWCVAEAIDSVLATGEPALELVIVDDGSTDGTPGILAGYARRLPDRVRVHAHPGRVNRGIAPSRNLGASLARGRYLAFLDSDDLFHPHRFAHALDWLDRHPDHAGCIEPFEITEMDGAARHTLAHLTAVAPENCGWLQAMLFSTTFWPMPAITLRRRALATFGGFDERLRVGEEIALWLKLAASDKIGVAQATHPIALVRRHAGHSWADADRRTEHAVYLRVLHTLLDWISEHALPARVGALARARLRQSLVELLLDDALPRAQRARLWADSALRAPRVAFSRRVGANLARMLLGLRQWK